MAECSVWQLHGGLPSSGPGSSEIWVEALQSATVTRIKKLNVGHISCPSAFNKPAEYSDTV